MVVGIFTNKFGKQFSFTVEEAKVNDIRWYKNEVWKVKAIHNIDSADIAVIEIADNKSNGTLFVNAAEFSLHSYKIVRVVVKRANTKEKEGKTK